MREIFYDSKLCYKLGHGVLETLTTQRKFKRRRARASLMEMTDVAATFGSRPCEELKVRISQTVLLLLRLFQASQLGRSVALNFFFKCSGSFPDRTYPTLMSQSKRLCSCCTTKHLFWRLGCSLRRRAYVNRTDVTMATRKSLQHI